MSIASEATLTRFVVRTLLTLVVAATAFVGVGVGSATAASTIAPTKIAGTYTFHSKFGESKYSTHTIKLLANHTGSDGIAGDSITWKTKGRKITIVGSSSTVTATFVGTVTNAGFNSAKHPGTITNTLGDKGVWYAVKAH